MASALIFLTENGIPDTSLLGRKANGLKNSELKFQLNCHGDAGKGLKTTRAGTYKWVKINCLWVQILTKLEKQGTSSKPDSESNESVQFPSSGWGTSLEKMPMFTQLQKNCHVLKSGKAIANLDHHTIPMGLVKARHIYIYTMNTCKIWMCEWFQILFFS